MTANSPISTIIPVRNGAAYIGETIGSLLSQTLPPFEIIVVDDGSSDDSAQIAQSVGGEKVQIIKQGPLGPNAARNAGVKAASCNLVHFMDSDDLFLPKSYQFLADSLDENPGWDAAFGEWENFWIEGLADERDAAQGTILAKRQSSPMLTTGLFRARFLEKSPAFSNDELRFDAARWLVERDHEDANFGAIADLVLRRRIHRHNLSRSQTNDDWLDLVAQIIAQKKKKARDQINKTFEGRE